MRKFLALLVIFWPHLVSFTAAGQTGPCVSPTSPTGHAVCLGIPEGPDSNLGTCVGDSGAVCDPLNWNAAKFTTVGLTTSPTRTDYYFVGHNNRIFHNFQDALGAWQEESAIAVEFAEDSDPGNGPNSTVGLGTVLHQDGVKFVHPVSKKEYDYAMYMVYQFDPDDGSAGHVCVSFADENGDEWTDAIRVADEDTAAVSCRIGQTVHHPLCDDYEFLPACKLEVEAFSGFLLPEPTSETGIGLFAGVEGRLADLACQTYPSGVSLPPTATTMTSLFRLSTDQPDRVETLGVLPFLGMKTPSFLSGGRFTISSSTSIWLSIPTLGASS